MSATCKRCAAAVDPDTATDGALRCPECDALWDTRLAPRPAVALPGGMLVHRTRLEPAAAGDPYRSPGRVRDDVFLEWRWLKPRHAFVFAFTALWWAFLVFWYIVVNRIDAPLIFQLFPALHIISGVVLTYVCAALLINRTAITLRGDRLDVVHRPLLWRGNQALPVADIDQLYCTEGVAYTVNDNPVPGYNVIARTRGGHEVTLVRNLPEPDQALYIEQELERVLSLTDRPVAGELER